MTGMGDSLQKLAVVVNDHTLEPDRSHVGPDTDVDTVLTRRLCLRLDGSENEINIVAAVYDFC